MLELISHLLGIKKISYWHNFCYYKLMREKGAIGIVILIIVVLGIGIIGGLFLFGKKEEAQTSKSLKPDTSLSTKEQESPENKIVEKGVNMYIEIEPSVGNTISGVVNVSATSTPKDTNSIGFVVVEKIEDLITGDGKILGTDSDGSDGWTSIFDTTEFENGLYFVVSIASAKPGGNPNASANVQVEINN
jgi:hypothetical protein